MRYLSVDDLADLAIANGGFTARRVPGATGSFETVEPNSGYAVALSGHEVTVAQGDLPSVLASYVGARRARLSGDVCVGAWEESPGVFVLDLSEVKTDMDDALLEAWDCGQRAIWDFANGCDIPVAGRVSAHGEILEPVG